MKEGTEDLGSKSGEITFFPNPLMNSFQVVKCGWLDREITHGYLLFTKYSPRYLVLTSTFLRYYHHIVKSNELLGKSAPPEEHDNPTPTPRSRKREYTEIPFTLINETLLLSSAHHEPDMLHVENTETGKLFRFRASSAEEALLWRTALLSARSKLVPANKVHFPPTKHAPSAVEQETNLVAVLNHAQTLAHLAGDVEHILFSSVERVKFVADGFFDSLAHLPAKERTNRAKEMGKALVYWVEYDTHTLAHRRYSKLAKIDILAVWLRAALSREFVSSCKFEETAAGDDADLSSESSSVTHSTAKSRMRHARRGSIIMPFRSDTVECLFVSAVIHSSCARENTLRSILHPVLRPVAACPDTFSYPKPVLVPIPHPAPPALTGSSYSAPTPSSNPRASRSWRWFGLVRHAVFGGSADRQRSRESSRDNSRPSSLDGRVVSGSFAPITAASADLAFPSPLELKRTETRRALIELAAALTEGLQDCALAGRLPPPVTLIMRTIRDLIMSPLTSSSSPTTATEGGAQTEKEKTSEEESETIRQRKRFEFGTYFTSCSALLFLRLICRAIISPDEYGVVHKTAQSFLESIAEKQSVPSPPRALPAMAILAHTVNFANLKPDKDGSVVSRHHNREFISAQELQKLVTTADELKREFSHDMILQCLDFMQATKFSAEREGSPAKAEVVVDNDSPYQFDFSKPSTRWALAEVAKAVQHIANISCLPKEEMQAFAKESLVRQNIAAGIEDKDSYDMHAFTGPETDAILSQIQVAARIKEVYEKLGDLPAGNW